MRTDVKIGLVLSLVVVVIAGVYLVGRDKGDPVSMDGKSATAGDDASKSKPADATASKPGRRDRSDQPGPVTERPTRDRKPRSATKPLVRTADRSQPRGSGSAAASSRDAGVKPGAGSATKTPPEGSRLLSDILPGGGDESVTAPPRRTVPGTSALTSGPREPGAKSPDDGKKIAVGGSASKPVPGRDATKSTPATTPAGAAAKKSTEARPMKEPVRLVGRAPRPQPNRLPPTARTHVIAEGDTLAILAEIYYESQMYADYLLEVNPGLDAKRLMVGTVILVPEKPGDKSVINPIGRPAPAVRKPADTAAAAPPRASGETYTVKSGDSLWKIAKRELGDQSKWQQIFDLNQDRLKSPDRLRVGQVLRLPER